MPKKKPAPDIYHFTLDEMDLAPGDCIAMEDSANGVLSAVAAGIPVVVTENDYTRHDDFSGAVAVLSGLGEPDCPVTARTGKDPANGIVDCDYLASLI